MRVAVVGATGAVGQVMLDVLGERRFPVTQLDLLASAHSAGKVLPQGTVREATPEAFVGVDVALFSAGSELSRRLAPAARDAGALVVDNSSAFRMDADCPLVIPEVNGEAIAGHGGIIANPNCSTILLCMALAPLHRAVGIRRVVVCSYQAVSGAGVRARQELELQEAADARGEEPAHEIFPKVLSHNVIPWVQAFEEDGYSTEETKVRDETRRILGEPGLPVAATCVRVPVWSAHAEAVHVELAALLSPDEAREVLAAAEGVKVAPEGDFPTPREVAGTDWVQVGRIRGDRAFEPGLALWCVMDQLRKGAAVNAIQIAERALGTASAAQRREP